MPRELPYVTCKKQRKVEPSLADAENEKTLQGAPIMGRIAKPPKNKQAISAKQLSKPVILPKHLNFQGGQLRNSILNTKQSTHLSQSASRVTKDTALVQ